MWKRTSRNYKETNERAKKRTTNEQKEAKPTNKARERTTYEQRTPEEQSQQPSKRDEKADAIHTQRRKGEGKMDKEQKTNGS